MRLGVHTSIAGSLDRAAERAIAIGANTLQIFSTSPRSWRGRAFSPREVSRFQQLRRDYDLWPLAVHTNYLINLAAQDRALRAKSIDALRQELERALLIGAEYVVMHPGRAVGQTKQDGLEQNAEGLIRACEGLGKTTLVVLLENTAGAGSSLGARLEELAWLRHRVEPHVGLQLGFCLDTAHCLAAGYDVATAAGLRATVELVEEVLGWDHVHLIHANDSRAPLGSRLDRHEHIGKGYIGKRGFRRILAETVLQAKPFILETPVEKAEDDRRNLEALKRLCPKRCTTTR